MANSFAPVQLLRTDWNPDIWTAFDNGTDSRTNFAVSMNPSVLPTDKNKFAVGCILIMQATAQIYLNIGTTDIPNWQAFGPGTGVPVPLLTGRYLTNDGTTAFWDYVNLATGVTGILDISHINMAQIEAFLLADNTWLTNLANNATFLSALTTNISGSVAVSTDGTLTGNGTTGSPLHVVGGGGGAIDVQFNGSTIVTGATALNVHGNASVANEGSNVAGITILGGGSGGTKLVLDTTPHIVNGNGSANPLYTEVIPGGTLGTNDAIRYTIIGAAHGIGGGLSLTFTVNYGAGGIGASTVHSPGSGAFSNNSFSITGIIAANGATDQQIGSIISNLDYFNTSAPDNQFLTSSGGGNIDSTINQNLVITATSGNGSVSVLGILIEKISAPGTTGPVNPSIQSFIFEDFIGGDTSNGQIGELGWTVHGSPTIQKAASDATHRGVINIAGDGTSNSAGISLGSGVGEFDVFNVPNLTLEYLVKLTHTGDETLVGLLSGFGGGVIGLTGKMAFISNSGNWTGYYNGLSGDTTTASSIATTTGWVKLKIVTDGTGANVEYFVDGVSLGTLATDAYAGNAVSGIAILTSTNIISADYSYYNQSLTR